MPLNDERTLAIGMISLAIAILIGRFLHFQYVVFSIAGFVEGILIGLSLVMRIAYFIKRRRN